MIDIKDLAIGNYVMYDGEICQVERISSEDYVLLSDVFFEVRLDDIEPVLITKDIMEKNGFSGAGYGILNIDDFLYFEYYYHEARLRKIWEGVDEWQNHTTMRDITFQCHCHYVHELQNALRLAGYQKEIEL